MKKLSTSLFLLLICSITFSHVHSVYGANGVIRKQTPTFQKEVKEKKIAPPPGFSSSSQLTKTPLFSVDIKFEQ